MAEVQQEDSRGSFLPGPTLLAGTGTISTTLTVSTGLSAVHAVALNYAKSGGSTELYWTASGGVVTVTGDNKLVSYIIVGLI